MGKVLITGATGFIGNHVTRLCLERGDEVRVMVMPREDRSPLQGMDVEIVEGNLLDPHSLSRAVQGVQQLYHLAALFAISSLALSMVKYGGALYLICLGVKMLRTISNSSPPSRMNSPPMQSHRSSYLTCFPFKVEGSLASAAPERAGCGMGAG